MKINWKIIVAIVLMVGAIAWTVDSTRSKSYSGTNLDFEVGNDTVTMTNPSTESIPVQLVAASNRSFSVSSTIDDIPRISVREGTNPNITNVIAFELPPGVTEFAITRGSDVSFIADTNTNLEATRHAANIGTKILVLMVFLVITLFYISHTTKHRWLYTLLGREPASRLHSKPYDGEQDADTWSYNDNTVKKSSEPHSNH